MAMHSEEQRQEMLILFLPLRLSVLHLEWNNVIYPLHLRTVHVSLPANSLNRISCFFLPHQALSASATAICSETSLLRRSKLRSAHVCPGHASHSSSTVNLAVLL